MAILRVLILFEQSDAGLQSQVQHNGRRSVRASFDLAPVVTGASFQSASAIGAVVGQLVLSAIAALSSVVFQASINAASAFSNIFRSCVWRHNNPL
jgi:hypothetical protein